MKKYTHHVALLTAKLFVLFGVFSFVSGCQYADILDDLRDKDEDNQEVFKVKLGALNDSGVKGHVTLMLKGHKLTVKVKAKGLEANSLHPQHIHGLENNEKATCPPASADKNDNGLVEIGEGLPFYGGVLLPLAPFSMAPDGTIDYKET